MTKAKSKGINPDLEAAVSKLLKGVMDAPDGEGRLLDQLRVIDRALNLEKIKQKISDEEWGSGFNAPEDEEEAT